MRTKHNLELTHTELKQLVFALRMSRTEHQHLIDKAEAALKQANEERGVIAHRR